MKVIIVGGVAGGASAAARLRRMNEEAEIILLEQGEYVSYANCGLPYYIGGVITQKSALTVQTPEALRARLNLDLRMRHRAVEILPGEKLLRIRDLEKDAIYEESYDTLLLAPGAEAIHPPFPGSDSAGVFTLRTIPDTYRIREFIEREKPRRALVVGGGYIGLEMVDNLAHAGLAVTVAEKADHVIAPLDIDMAAELHQYLKSQGVELLLQNGVQSITPQNGALRVQLETGELATDMVLLSIGVRPDTALAKGAGLAVDSRGAIVVDSHMRTSDPSIYAVGDAVQIIQPVTGVPGYTPLAGPANKQGRIAADNIAGIPREYKGTQGSALIKLFDLTVGSTGLNETTAHAAGLSFDKAYLSAASHAGYYPGAEAIHMKVLFETPSGRILGAQLIGKDGVDKRLDVLGVAIRHRLTADDLTDLELAYAPPYSSAKDPVNMAGYVIQNLLEGRTRQFHWNDVPALHRQGAVLVDARTPAEYAAGHLEGAINIPIDDLRRRSGELDKAKPVYIYCQSGQRSYMASRILEKNGFTVSHLDGGYQRYASVVLGTSTDFAPT